MTYEKFTCTRSLTMNILIAIEKEKNDRTIFYVPESYIKIFKYSKKQMVNVVIDNKI